MEKITTERIPEWAICYLINGETDNLSKRKLKRINNWLKDSGLLGACPEIKDPEIYFSWCPAFGRPTNVYDVDFYK